MLGDTPYDVEAAARARVPRSRCAAAAGGRRCARRGDGDLRRSRRPARALRRVATRSRGGARRFLRRGPRRGPRVSARARHRQTAAHAQRDDRLRHDGRARHEPQPPAAGDGREDERPLHPGELLADADARAARRTGSRRTSGARDRARSPPGIQRSGSKRSASGHQRGSRCTTHWLASTMRARGQLVPPISVRLRSRAARGSTRAGRGACLREHGPREGQPREVLAAPEPIARAPRRPRRGARASTSGCWARRYQVQREQVRRRLVAGEEERHRLVAELPVAHPAAVALVVLRRSSIESRSPRSSPDARRSAMMPVDRRVESLASAPEPQRASGWGASRAARRTGAR